MVSLILIYLKSGKEHHLLLGAIDALVENLPLGLLEDEVDPHRVSLGVEVVEGVELEPQEERVKVPDALLHQREGGVEPSGMRNRFVSSSLSVRFISEFICVLYDLLKTGRGKQTSFPFQDLFSSLLLGHFKLPAFPFKRFCIV